MPSRVPWHATVVVVVDDGVPFARHRRDEGGDGADERTRQAARPVLRAGRMHQPVRQIRRVRPPRREEAQEVHVVRVHEHREARGGVHPARRRGAQVLRRGGGRGRGVSQQRAQERGVRPARRDEEDVRLAWRRVQEQGLQGGAVREARDPRTSRRRRRRWGGDNAKTARGGGAREEPIRTRRLRIVVRRVE